MEKELLLEINIPYCITPEKYFDRLYVTGSNEEKDAYMWALKKEALVMADDASDYVVRAVRLDGFASVMNPDLLGELLYTVRTHYPLSRDCEISFGALPNTVGTPSLTGIAQGKPTRCELYMESENDAELRALACPFSMQDTRNAMLFLNKFHMNNLSLHIVPGIPDQTAQSWHNTVHAAAIMNPGHVRIAQTDVTDADKMPAAEARFLMYQDAAKLLSESGYIGYAAGRFCKPGFEHLFDALQMNGAEVLALGAGAVSSMDGFVTRSLNQCKLYIKYAGDMEKTTAKAYELTEEARIRAYASGRLQLSQGLQSDLFIEKFDRKIPAYLAKILDELAQDGLLTVEQNGFVPTQKGLFMDKEIKKRVL